MTLRRNFASQLAGNRELIVDSSDGRALGSAEGEIDGVGMEEIN